MDGWMDGLMDGFGKSLAKGNGFNGHWQGIGL
jgi:hypothetical protein